MRTVSSGMQTHLESEEQTVALCWRIQRRDGTNYYFTDHDEIIPLSGHSYTPIDAGSPSNYRQGSNLNPSNMDLGMAFSSTSGRAAELRAGLFDYAEVWTFRVNWSSPSTVNMVKLAYGRLGEVEIRDNEARIEMRSLTQLLAVPIGNIYTPECRTDLGSSLCKVATSSTTYTRAGTISAVTSNKVFTVAGSASGQAADFYNYGTVRFNAGANNGVLLQVEDYTTGNVVTLLEPAPYALTTGISVTLVAGCNRRFATCKDRFNNKDNFRGFPRIPGMNKALTVPANMKWTEN